MHNKENGLNRRANSHANFSHSLTPTLAELNHVSPRALPPRYQSDRPARIFLPDYFNIPKFQDSTLFGAAKSSEERIVSRLRGEAGVRQQLRDLSILGEGMRRARNIKEESRYLFTQAVLLHNAGEIAASISSLEKFLKIVLFIRDEKSVELALNSIGCGYLALRQPMKAIEYHRKQREIERVDLFPSLLNCGLAYEMAQDYDSAEKEYKLAETMTKGDKLESRRNLIQKMLDRIQSKKEAVFVTGSGQGRDSPMGRSFLKQASRVSQSPLRNSSSGRLQDTTKITMAICTAQSKMEDYLQNMKNSFIIQRDD